MTVDRGGDGGDGCGGVDSPVAGGARLTPVVTVVVVVVVDVVSRVKPQLSACPSDLKDTERRKKNPPKKKGFPSD